MTRASQFVIIGLISAALLFLCSHQLKEDQFSPESDEGYYFHYAKVISEKGIAGFPELINWYASSEKARFHPTPSRAGYTLFTACLFKITGPSYTTLGTFSLISFLLFLFFSFYFSQKHFNTDTALFLTLLLSSSPLMLAMSRRALTDSVMNLMWGVTVWIFLDFLLAPRKKSYFIFLLCFSLSIMIKESTLVLLPFFLIAALIHKYAYKGEISWPCIIGTALWPILIVISLYFVILSGGGNFVVAVKSVLTTHFEAHHSNPYAIKYSSGPWFRYLVDFLLLSPISTLLFVGYSTHILITRKFQWKTTYFLLYFLIVYGILNSLGHSKVVRFVINLDMVISLFTVLALYELLGHQDQRIRDKRLVSCLTIIFFINFFTFTNFFYIDGLLDPISYHLLVLRHFIAP